MCGESAEKPPATRRVALGHGVSARFLADGTLFVEGAAATLSWSPPRGVLPGTAVLFEDALFEVRDVERRGATSARFTLAPWRGSEAARGVFALDAAAVAALAADESDRRAAFARRRWLWPLLPLMALAPRPLQERWAPTYDLPLYAASLLVAAAETMIGAVGVVARFAGVAGGTFLPRGFGWLETWGPALAASGLVRLGLALRTGRPVGHLLGAWLWLFLPRPATPAGASAPRPAAGWIARRWFEALLFGFARAAEQERWAAARGGSAAALTAAFGAVELFGGLSNVAAPQLRSGGLLWLQLWFVGEGAARVAAGLLFRRPLGSAAGWILAPLIRRVALDAPPPEEERE